jgi:type I restriction enzyme S subunit
MQLSRWFLLCLMADAGGRAELVERAYGAGKPGLNLDNIRSLSVPLAPPADDTRRRLLDALLAEALEPAAVQRDAA